MCAEIAQRGASGLVIDLRENSGGAFAGIGIKPDIETGAANALEVALKQF